MDIGTGTSITFSTGFLAEILDITPPGPSRGAVDTSHMGTSSYKTFIPTDLVDWGELKVEMAFAPSADPPIEDVAESIVITFPDATTWTFSGFMTNFEAKVPLEDKMTATATIKVTGNVVNSAGS